jgi:hypothetical protein
MDFTRISKGTLLLKLQFCGPAPETFWHFTDMPLLCTKHLGQNERNAIGSFAMASGGPAKSGQAGSVLGREKGRGDARAHLRLNCGRGWAVEAPAGSHGGGGRGEPPRSLLRRGAGQCGATGD